MLDRKLISKSQYRDGDTLQISHPTGYISSGYITSSATRIYSQIITDKSIPAGISMTVQDFQIIARQDGSYLTEGMDFENVKSITEVYRISPNCIGFRCTKNGGWSGINNGGVDLQIKCTIKFA